MFRVLVAVALVSAALVVSGCTGSLRLGSSADAGITTTMVG